jgi:hypothetical protein
MTQRFLAKTRSDPVLVHYNKHGAQGLDVSDRAYCLCIAIGSPQDQAYQLALIKQMLREFAPFDIHYKNDSLFHACRDDLDERMQKKMAQALRDSCACVKCVGSRAAVPSANVVAAVPSANVESEKPLVPTNTTTTTVVAAAVGGESEKPNSLVVATKKRAMQDADDDGDAGAIGDGGADGGDGGTSLVEQPAKKMARSVSPPPASVYSDDEFDIEEFSDDEDKAKAAAAPVTLVQEAAAHAPVPYGSVGDNDAILNVPGLVDALKSREANVELLRGPLFDIVLAANYRAISDFLFANIDRLEWLNPEVDSIGTPVWRWDSKRPCKVQYPGTCRYFRNQQYWDAEEIDGGVPSFRRDDIVDTNVQRNEQLGTDAVKVQWTRVDTGTVYAVWEPVFQFGRRGKNFIVDVENLVTVLRQEDAANAKWLSNDLFTDIDADKYQPIANYLAKHVDKIQWPPPTDIITPPHLAGTGKYLGRSKYFVFHETYYTA